MVSWSLVNNGSTNGLPTENLSWYMIVQVLFVMNHSNVLENFKTLPGHDVLSHWVTDTKWHLMASWNFVNIGSTNGLSHVQHQTRTLDWIGLDLFNDDTRPSGHISHPTQVNVSQSCFYSLNKLEQLEHLLSEILPAAPWLPILVIHIRSQVKTTQSQSYKF